MVIFAIILPAFVGIVGVVADGGLLTANQRHLQNVSDAAATAAAMDLYQGTSFGRATNTALSYVRYYNGLDNARIKMRRPPRHGPYAGDDRYVELEVSRDMKTYLVHLLGGASAQTISARSVAGVEPSTADAAITVLSTTPNGQVAGLNFVAGGTVRVDGAVLVNCESGAVDENGEPAGNRPGPPFGIRSTGATIVASNIRVAGGIDDPRPYRQADLRANQLPVEDPLQQLTPPTTGRTGSLHGQLEFGGVEVTNGHGNRGRRPRTRTLTPGIYDWIRATTGRVTFQPGIYVIRSVHPDTRVALDVRGSQVTAHGVLFYIDTAAAAAAPTWPGYVKYDAYADDDLDSSSPASASFRSNGSTPSVIIDVSAQSKFSPLEDSSSPYDGMLLFQNRRDRRSIQINYQRNPASRFAGIVYARSGHVNLTARGTCQASFVVGTMRIRAPSGCRIQPLTLMPPAEDVYLVE